MNLSSILNNNIDGTLINGIEEKEGQSLGIESGYYDNGGLHTMNGSSSSDSEKISSNIHSLVDNLIANKNVIEGIALLESIIQTKRVLFTPTIMIKTRLRIAELLIQYTENVDEALLHLSKAVRRSLISS